METRKSTLNYELYERDAEYKAATNFNAYVTEAQNFYNGNHYQGVNEGNMIRVSMNFCSFATNIKASKVVGTQTYVTFTADNSTYDTVPLQRFDEYNISKLDEKTENFQSALNGFNNGTEIAYYRWDETDTTYKGIYKGGLALEHIDILQFAVANPYLQGIQNQKWVMFWKAQDCDAVRDMVERSSEAERKKVMNAICPDTQLGTDPVKREYVSHGLTTVYTRYFRIDGEVYFMCSTKEYDLFEYPHALSPEAEARNKRKVRKIYEDKASKETGKVDDLSIDPEDLMMQVASADPISEGEYDDIKERFSLYPFAYFAPYAINNSFYGRSDVKPMIPIQKGINFALSMVLKCVENNAYNKIFAKEGALQGQEITNEPGQLITDHSRMTNGWGIKFAESQPMPNGVIDFTSNLFSMTRVVYGFNDVMDGSVSNQDISGYAVQQMIKQANSSIEQQQQLFWKFCKDKAAIRLMFYKHYVDTARYSFELEDYEVEKREQDRKALIDRRNRQGFLDIGNDIDLSAPTTKTQIRSFRGSDIRGKSFDISIDVMQGLGDSKLAESQMWDTLIMNGGIQNMTPENLELYLHANPMVSERSKATLKSIVEKQKQSENAQLKQKLTEAVQMIQQLSEYAKQMEAQNGYKSNYISNLEKEFTNKINVANKTIEAQSRMLSSNPRSEGQTKSDNARGISSAQAAAQQPVQ